MSGGGFEEKRVPDAILAAANESADRIHDMADDVLILVHIREGDDDKVLRVRRGSQYIQYAMAKEVALTWEQYVKSFADMEQRG